MLDGFDVSQFQTPEQVKAGAFVFAKVGEGLSWPDPQYATHAEAARDAGQLFGGYWLCWPTFDPVSCARNAVKLAGLQPGEVFAVDFEPLTVKSKLSAWEPAEWPAWLAAFIAEVGRLLGVKPWLYVNDWHATQLEAHATASQLALFRQCPLWKAGVNNSYVASPDGDVGDLHGWASWTCWQWTDSGGSLDRDVFRGDGDDWRLLGVPEGDSLTHYTACGYPALDGFPSSFTAPNGHVCSTACDAFAIVASRYSWRHDTEVSSVKSAFGGRTVAEQEATYRHLGLPCNYTSNHLAGYAWDMGDGRQVFEPNQSGAYRSGYTPEQERRIDAILADDEFGGVLEWGHHFTSPYRDPVHFQLRQKYPYGSGPYPKVVSHAELKRVARGISDWVKKVQRALHCPADGVGGPSTIAAVKAFQKAHGLVVDGVVGPVTEAALFGTADRGDDAASRDHDRKPIRRRKRRHGLTPDGVFGRASVRALMDAAGVKGRAVISSQPRANKAILGGITAVQYATRAEGSKTVAWLQNVVGVRSDGVLGPDTIRAIQKFLRRHGFPRTPVDGVWGAGLSERVQRALNRGVFK